MAHTPGPWIIDGKRAVYHVHSPNGAVRDICIMAGDITEQRLTDARLIAAAPLMLEALWAADEAFSTLSSEWCARERELVRVAIAKATGK